MIFILPVATQPTVSVVVHWRERPKSAKNWTDSFLNYQYSCGRDMSNSLYPRCTTLVHNDSTTITIHLWHGDNNSLPFKQNSFTFTTQIGFLVHWQQFRALIQIVTSTCHHTKSQWMTTVVLGTSVNDDALRLQFELGRCTPPTLSNRNTGVCHAGILPVKVNKKQKI